MKTNKQAFNFTTPLLAVLLTLGCGALLLWTSNGQEVAAQPVTAAAAPTASDRVEVDLLALAEAGILPPDTIIHIADDIVFGTAKTFRAYPLKPILEPYLEQLGITPNSEAVVTFHCTDGYVPVQKLKTIWEGAAYLAFRDESLADPNQHWPDSLAAKFEPYYLVWERSPAADSTQLVAPYGLHQLTLRAVDDIYAPIYPQHERLAAGFELYKDHCIKCHSINRIGGTMGPEFNEPRNITSYLDIEMMWAYVQNPQSFRYNARMHPIKDLSRAEFDEIIAYLKGLDEGV